MPRGGELDTLRRRDRPDDELRAAPESGQLLAADHHERGGLDRAKPIQVLGRSRQESHRAVGELPPRVSSDDVGEAPPELRTAVDALEDVGRGPHPQRGQLGAGSAVVVEAGELGVAGRGGRVLGPAGERGRAERERGEGIGILDCDLEGDHRPEGQGDEMPGPLLVRELTQAKGKGAQVLARPDRS